VDLSPRESTTAAPPAKKRRWGAIAALVLVLVGGGVLVSKFLTSAIDYYCNVDDVGNKDGCDAGRKLRVQGVVEQGTVRKDGATTYFSIEFNGVTMPVRYNGDPGGIFQECIPVVVHGALINETFEGDKIDVKHTNEYEAENKDRIAESDTESAACSLPPA
jgi:cytochrome c-type biogenesis protein CcmE